MKSMSFFSIVICLSEKFFSKIAKINSSSGFSILANKQFLVRDIKSANLKFN